MNELEEALNNGPAPIGHNQPPALTEILRERLETETADLLRRRDELLAALSRLPEKCATKETAEKLTSFGNQLTACIGQLEDRRKAEKRHFDELGSVVHSFFQNHKSLLEVAVTKVKDLLLMYKIDQDNARRAAQQAEKDKAAEEAKKARAESDRLISEAAKLEQAGMTDAASQALTQAHQREIEANTTAAFAATPTQPEKTIVRGSIGGSASAQARWAVRITDINKIDLRLILPYLAREAIEKALRELMRLTVKKLAKNETPPVFEGFEIYRDEQISLRG